MHRNNVGVERNCPARNVESSGEGCDGVKKRVTFIIFSAILLSVGLIFKFILKWELPAELLFLATAVISGYSIVREGLFLLIFRKRLSIDLLIMMAAVGSFFIGHEEEGAAVIFLFYVAESLEGYAAERARMSIESLMKLAPEVATVKRGGEEVEVPLSEDNILSTIYFLIYGNWKNTKRNC